MRPSSLVRTVEPSADAVSLATFKDHARIDTPDDDQAAASALAAAMRTCENFIERSLIEQAWRARWFDPPSPQRLTLPRGPVASVAALKLFDGATLASVDAADYELLADGDPAQIVPAHGKTWSMVKGPITVECEFDAGYGASGDDVPAPIRQAILLLATDLYNRRAGLDFGTNVLAGLPPAVERLLAPFRVLQ